MNGASTKGEDGAALVTVLLIIAVMSAVAVSVTDTINRATLRARASDERARVAWYLAGAEELGRVGLVTLQRQTGGRLNTDTPNLNQPTTFPIEGGILTATLSDASNCLNLNGLLPFAGGGDARVDPDRLREVEIVLEAAGLPQNDAEAIAATIADWIDPDNTPRRAGAEDAYYASLRPSYRTAGRHLADLSELRAIRGFEDPALLDALEPVLCVRPTADPAVLNLNTLRIEEAPLIVMAMDGQIDITEAQNLIAERPRGGWADVEEFLEIGIVAQIAPERRKDFLLATESSHLRLQGEVVYRDGARPFSVLYAYGASGSVEVAERTYGEF